MTDDTLAEVRAKIQDVDWILSSGRFPAEGILDLKSAVDDLRNRIWALVTAAAAEDPAQVLARLRARRAADMLRATLRDLLAGHIGLERAEMLALSEASRDLSAETSRPPQGAD
ncbi:MAG TPA: hypothetical protein VD707_02310 [Gemmatimonadales bacterium]|jgi:hypothetical protein|nr:hypothetical protein [Gemmatimonadales bacterium]